MAETNTIGPYRVLEPLGRGGMGVVYRARHTGSKRAIALKTVEETTPHWLDSIRREIHALTRIRHQGIVRIVDHGVHQGRPWYAMDLLEGESLRYFGQRIWSPYLCTATAAYPDSTESLSATVGPPGKSFNSVSPEPKTVYDPRPRFVSPPPAAAGELRTVLLFFRRICATLAYLHGEGFVNCDLKPGNILLVGDQPVIIDFGLAEHHPGSSGREEFSPQHDLYGTLPYMSPEQIRGEFVDARSDLYAVGCMLYEFVVGSAPFLGITRSVVKQHLSVNPTPPSEIVFGVPPKLEQLILKLLEKNLLNRFGYAEEVAAILADISGDIRHLPNYPPSRSYLYRPRFVDRRELYNRLSALRDRACGGNGCLVVLGGESGVGKTRFAMELTRITPGSPMRIIAAEASSLSTESAAAVGPVPLHAIRPILQVIADRCQEGGPEVTKRLLGHRRSVLAPYEPLLACVPETESQPPSIPLPVEAARQRLFKYLAETIANFAQERPVLWVIDDAGWADELSLAFLESLTAQYLDTTAIFILCAYRSEEHNRQVTALTQLPHVVHVILPRLESNDVRLMIGDMLALEEPPKHFVDFVSHQAEGIPFFVAEYLNSAVNERILFRDQDQSWRVNDAETNDIHDYDRIPLPRSLLKLIERRLHQVSPAAQQLVTGAAVLGRESDLSLLQEVTTLSDEVLVGAIDELMRRQVLEQSVPGRIRFVHDKLREVAYANASHERLVWLHTRAATCLESRWQGRSDESSIWATLGHHFAAAQLSNPAARYLRLAADHARASFANADAIRLYQESINQARQALLRFENDSKSGLEELVNLYESLGDVLALTGRRDEARQTYHDALASESGTVTRARVYRKIGKTWETESHHEEALRWYGLAQSELGGDPQSPSLQVRDEWIHLHIDQLWVYYWLGRVPEMDELSRTLEPVIDKHATAIQRARFCDALVKRNLRRDRYTICEDTLRLSTIALQASQESGDLSQVLNAQFGLGFVLLFHGQVELAEADLGQALHLAERGGDLAQQARCLTYHTVAARMSGRIQDTQRRAERGIEVSTAAGMLEYLAAAKANLAWVALRQGNLDETIRLTDEALETWRGMTSVFPFKWLALLPFMEASLRRYQLADAISCINPLLAPGEQHLPGATADALVLAAQHWETGHIEEAQSAVARALKHLEGTDYS